MASGSCATDDGEVKDAGTQVGFAEQAKERARESALVEPPPIPPSPAIENQTVVLSTARYVCGLIHANGCRSAWLTLNRKLCGPSRRVNLKHFDQL